MCVSLPIFREFKTVRAVKWWIWLIGFIISTILDAISTFFFMTEHNFDPSREANPLARYLFEKWGIVETFLIHGGLPILIILFIGLYLAKRGKLSDTFRFFVFYLCLARFLAVIWNTL
jgi:hypothetical protein